MKPESISPEDSQLRNTLREWQVASPLPPRFEEDVWRRIERTAPVPVDAWAAIRMWVTRALARPSFAVSYATILVLAGLLGGLWQGRAAASHEDQLLRTRYVQMVDPYQMPRP